MVEENTEPGDPAGLSPSHARSYTFLSLCFAHFTRQDKRN